MAKIMQMAEAIPPAERKGPKGIRPSPVFFVNRLVKNAYASPPVAATRKANGRNRRPTKKAQYGGVFDVAETKVFRSSANEYERLEMRRCRQPCW